MGESEALEMLSNMVAADEEPTLTELQLDRLVEIARRVDGQGLAPSDATWTPTWDLNAAAAEGWRRKAGKAAGQFSFTADGQTFHRAEMYRHCLSMAEHYAKKVVTSAPVGTTVL